MPDFCRLTPSSSGAQVSGVVSYSSVDQLKRDLRKQILEHAGSEFNLELQLEGVATTSALALVVEAYRLSDEHAVSLKVSGCSPDLLQLSGLVGLKQVLFDS